MINFLECVRCYCTIEMLGLGVSPALGAGLYFPGFLGFIPSQLDIELRHYHQYT